MEKHTLEVNSRKTFGRKVSKLRKQGIIPANVFGKGVKSASLQVDAKEFAKIHKAVGESSLVYLHQKGEETDRPVFIHEVTRHPVTEQTLHASFQQVDLKQKIVAPVALKMVGESPAEKEKLGILVQVLDEVEVEALPSAMPDHIDIDVTTLSEVGSSILVKDLKLATGQEMKTDPETVVVKVEQLAAEEVVETPIATEATVTEEGVAPATPAEPASSDQPEKPSQG